MELSGVWAVLLILIIVAVGIERAVEIVWNYAEWVLLNARSWQPSALKSPQYLQFKSGTSLVLGIVLGLLIANATGVRLFATLGNLLAMPTGWDVLLTGLILGAFTKPVHDLIGIVAQIKNWLGYAAIKQREEAGAQMAESVLKLAQSDAQMMIDVPGIGPARLADDENAPVEAAAAERYAELVRNRVAM